MHLSEPPNNDIAQVETKLRPRRMLLSPHPPKLIASKLVRLQGRSLRSRAFSIGRCTVGRDQRCRTVAFRRHAYQSEGILKHSSAMQTTEQYSC